MEYGIDQQDADKIRAVIASFPAIKQVVIFGSRAMGNYKPGSDIDLAVQAEGFTYDDVLELIALLEAIGMLNRFDIIDLTAIKDKEMLVHIEKAGKVFFKR